MLLKSIYNFARPHTIIGTILITIVSISRIILQLCLLDFSLNNLPWSLIFSKALLGLYALLAANLWIVGINQCCDVSIDKINKPWLPIAAQEFSLRKAFFLSIAGMPLAIYIVTTVFKPVLVYYLIGVFIGTIYSITGYRLKDNPYTAALAIIICRGLLLPLCIRYAGLNILNIELDLSSNKIILLNYTEVFLLIRSISYCFTVAVMKDVSDINGDKKYGCDTFAIKYSPRTIMMIAKISIIFLRISGIAILIFNILNYDYNLRYIAQLKLLGYILLVPYILVSLLDILTILKLNIEKKSITILYRLLWAHVYQEYLSWLFLF